MPKNWAACGIITHGASCTVVLCYQLWGLPMIVDKSHGTWGETWEGDETELDVPFVGPKFTGSPNPKSPRTIGRGLQKKGKGKREVERRREEAEGPLKWSLDVSFSSFFDKVGWRSKSQKAIPTIWKIHGAHVSWSRLRKWTPTHVCMYVCMCASFVFIGWDLRD